MDLVKDDDIEDAFPHNVSEVMKHIPEDPTKIAEGRNEFDTVRSATGTILASL